VGSLHDVRQALARAWRARAARPAHIWQALGGRDDSREGPNTRAHEGRAGERTAFAAAESATLTVGLVRQHHQCARKRSVNKGGA
jgi:hypothetical protein